MSHSQCLLPPSNPTSSAGNGREVTAWKIDHLESYQTRNDMVQNNNVTFYKLINTKPTSHRLCVIFSQ